MFSPAFKIDLKEVVNTGTLLHEIDENTLSAQLTSPGFTRFTVVFTFLVFSVTISVFISFLLSAVFGNHSVWLLLLGILVFTVLITNYLLRLDRRTIHKIYQLNDTIYFLLFIGKKPMVAKAVLATQLDKLKIDETFGGTDGSQISEVFYINQENERIVLLKNFDPDGTEELRTILQLLQQYKK